MIPPRVMLACAALLLALGLPWGIIGPESEFMAGWMTPMYCSVDFEGYMWCSPGMFWPGTVLPGQGATYAGYQSSARVTIVLGLILVAWWSQRGGRWPLLAAAGLQVAAVVLAGSALRSGAVIALIAAVLLVMEVGGGRLPESPWLSTPQARGA